MRRLAVLALTALAMSLGACGGADNADTTSTPATSSGLTAAQYRAKLSSLCQQAARDAQALATPTGANASSLADYFDAVTRLAQRRQVPLLALKPPPALAADHTELLRVNDETIRALEQSATAFRQGGDIRTVYDQFRARLDAAQRRANQLTKRLKVPRCRARLTTNRAAAQAPIS